MNPELGNPQDQIYPPLKPSGFTQQPNYQPKPQGTFQPKPQAYHHDQHQGSSSNPPPQADTNALLRQILEGQGRGAIDLATQMKGMHTKVDNIYGELNAKIERLNVHVYSPSHPLPSIQWELYRVNPKLIIRSFAMLSS